MAAERIVRHETELSPFRGAVVGDVEDPMQERHHGCMRHATAAAQRVSFDNALKILESARTMGEQVQKRGAERELDWGLLSESVGPRARLLRNALYSRSIATSEPFGLPTGSLTLMCLISANPGSSQADLAEYAGITGPRLVSVFDELERRGLVQRTRSESDRRRNVMSLTPKGERTMQALYSEVKHIEDAVRDELGPEGLAKFIEYLDRSVAALSREDGSSD